MRRWQTPRPKKSCNGCLNNLNNLNDLNNLRNLRNLNNLNLNLNLRSFLLTKDMFYNSDFKQGSFAILAMFFILHLPQLLKHYTSVHSTLILTEFHFILRGDFFRIREFGALPSIDLHVSPVKQSRLQHCLDKNTTIHTVKPSGRAERTKQRRTGPAGLLSKTY